MSQTENESQQPATRQPKAYSGFRRRAVRKIVVLTLIAIATLTVLSMTAARPDTLGVRKGKLAPLPESPNCVSTMAERESQKIEPIDVSGIDKPIEKLKQVIADEFPRAELTFGERNYLCYEFTSLIFRFVDDVEFVLIESELHFRSASRVGYSDLGANRKRMEKIRAAMK
jgi:uncharacterized protein (DUF1499 family)